MKLEAAIAIHKDIAQVKTYDQMFRKLSESIEESFAGKKLRKDKEALQKLRELKRHQPNTIISLNQKLKDNGVKKQDDSRKPVTINMIAQKGSTVFTKY